MRIFFATDIHGSEVCWRKFLNSAAFYKADLVVLGGDVTGKAMVPIVAHPGYWQVTLRGETLRLETKDELDAIVTRIRNSGFYPAVVSQDELTHLGANEGAVDERFSQEMLSSLDRWLDMADGKLHGGADPVHPQRRQRRHLRDRQRHRVLAVRQLRRGQAARPRRLLPGVDGLDQPDTVGHVPGGTGGRAGRQDRGGRRARARHGPGDLQLPRPALRHRAGRGARPGRGPAADARRRGDEAGGLQGGAGRDPRAPADALGARPHPREPCGQEDGPDAGASTPAASTATGCCRAR